MTFSTRGNPRLAQSGTALTSLGAVGGARGTAAGALRVFVEFLTTYNKENLNQLESDLANLDHASHNAAIAEEKRQIRLAQVQNQLAETTRVVRGKLNSQLRSDLKQIEVLETSRSSRNKAEAATQRTIFNTTAQSLGVTKSELDLLSKRGALRKEEDVLVGRQSRAEEAKTQRLRQQQVVQTQLQRIEVGRAALVPKLGGLAVGALGGIVGGAVLGIGFQLAQEALAKIGDVIQDIVDPARHARDSVLELGKAVSALADRDKISDIEAASKIVAQFGVKDTKLGSQLSDTLAEAAAQAKLVEQLKTEAQVLDVLKNQKGIELDLRKQVREILISEAIANGTLTEAVLVRGHIAKDVAINGVDIEAAVTERLNTLLGINTNLALENADAQRQLKNAALLAAAAQDQLNDAISRGAAAQGAAIDSRIEALGSGISARTQAIQAAIEKAQSSGSGTRASLRNIAEERALILLRQRLRLLGANIDLEKFSGKFLLEAINAKINALQKEGQAQSRLNQLLDLQFKMSQQIKRQAGESIADFVERRAQEQRNQLQEQAQLERDAQIAALEDRKQKVEDQVALAELAARREDVLRQAGLQAHIKALQKALKASQAADAAALAAKKKALEAEKVALAQSAADAKKYADIAATAEVQAMVRAAKTVEAIAQVAGKTRGLLAARDFLHALLESGVLNAAEAKSTLQAINRIQATLNVLEERQTRLADPGRPYKPFAKGGVFSLTNARSPFGSNMRTGEEGEEIGVILSHKVADILQKQKNGIESVGPFNLYASENPLRDMHRLKRAVTEGVAEALN